MSSIKTEYDKSHITEIELVLETKTSREYLEEFQTDKLLWH